jgi:hypothetical protein
MGEIGKVWTDFHFAYNPHENKARLFGLDRAGFNRYSITSASRKDSRIQLEILTQPVHVTYSNRKPAGLWETFNYSSRL